MESCDNTEFQKAAMGIVDICTGVACFALGALMVDHGLKAVGGIENAKKLLEGVLDGTGMALEGAKETVALDG